MKFILYSFLFITSCDIDIGFNEADKIKCESNCEIVTITGKVTNYHTSNPESDMRVKLSWWERAQYGCFICSKDYIVKTRTRKAVISVATMRQEMVLKKLNRLDSVTTGVDPVATRIISIYYQLSSLWYLNSLVN